MAENDIVFSVTAQDDASAILKKIGDYAQKMGKDTDDALKKSKASADDASGSFLKMAGAMGAGSVAVEALGKALEIAKDSVGKFFDANAEFESFKLQFKSLLGSTDEAKKRIAELQQFAKETPFELAGIAQASKQLQLAGGSALATGDSLRMVADASAMAGVNIDELGQWVARAYSGLQSGRPIGEAMQRMQELAVVSGEARNKIEDLQKAGKNEEAWKALQAELSKASGTSKELSMTLGGLASTLEDDLKNAFIDFGQNSGIIEVVREEMIGLDQAFSGDGVSSFANEFKENFLPSLVMGIELFKALGNVLNSFVLQPLKIIGTAFYSASLDLTALGQALKGDFTGASQTHREAVEAMDGAWSDFGSTLRKTFIDTDYIQNAQDKLDNITERMNKSEGVKKVEKQIDFVEGKAGKNGKGYDKEKAMKELDAELAQDKKAREARQKEAEKWADEQIKKNEEADAQAEKDKQRKMDDEFEWIRFNAEADSIITKNKEDENKKRIQLEKEYQQAKNETISMSLHAMTELADAFGANHATMKALMVAETIWNTSLAVMKTLAVGGPFAMPQAIAIGAMGAAQVAKIAQYEKGGYVQGARHSQGGVMAELEGGEFVLSRRDVVAMGGVGNIERMRRSASSINLGGFSPTIQINAGQNGVDGKQIINALEESMPEFSRMLQRSVRKGFAV